MATIISSSFFGAGLHYTNRISWSLSEKTLAEKPVFWMSTRVNNPVHVEVEIIKFNIIWIWL